jgi:hypothetical protein
LPEPAGAMMRAGPAPWPTAASWSGARAAVGSTGWGSTASRSSSTDSRCTTWAPPRSSAASGTRGPPSTHTGVPSSSRQSPGCPGPTGVAPSRCALRAHHQMGSPSRASQVLAHTRKWSRSCQGSNAGPTRHGSVTTDCGARNEAGSTARATTTGRRRDQCRWSDATAPAGSARTWSSTTTTGSSAHGAGTGAPASTTDAASERRGGRRGHRRDPMRRVRHGPLQRAALPETTLTRRGARRTIGRTARPTEPGGCAR